MARTHRRRLSDILADVGEGRISCCACGLPFAALDGERASLDWTWAWRFDGDAIQSRGRLQTHARERRQVDSRLRVMDRPWAVCPDRDCAKRQQLPRGLYWESQSMSVAPSR